MKLTIYGASGRVGRLLVSEAVERGHDVVAVTRTGRSLDLKHPQVTVVEADVMNPTTLAATLSGADAVIVSIGDDTPAGLHINWEGTQNIVTAMQDAGIRRIEVVGGFGSSPVTRDALEPSELQHFMERRAGMVEMVEAKERQDAVVRSSDLDFTMVEPAWMTDEPATGRYRHGPTFPGASLSATISRSDLVGFLLDNLEQDRYLRGTTLIQND